MSNRKTSMPEDLANITEIFCQLSNPKKLAVVQYLSLAGLATATVIQRKLQYKQSTLSKYLHGLTDCQLINREKIGYSVIYSINKKTWSQFSGQLLDLGK